MKGKCQWIAGLVLLFLLMDAEGDTRSFTNREGKTIEAEITTVREGKVYLKRDSQTYAVEIIQLSDEDQAFLREWVRNNFDYNLTFKATPTELKDQRTSRRGDNKEKWETEFWKYDVQIVNRSGIDLKNLTVDYRVVVRDEKHEDPGRGKRSKTETARTISGSTTFPLLANTDSAKFSSSEVKLPGHKWEVRRHEIVYDSGTREVNYWWDNFSDESVLDGIWLRVYLQDRLIGEWKSKGKLVKDLLWAYEKKAAPKPELPVAMAEKPTPEPDITSIPKSPPSAPMPPTTDTPPPVVGGESSDSGSIGGGGALSTILLSKRIQQKIQQIRDNPGDPALIREYQLLLDQQRSLISRRRQS